MKNIFLAPRSSETSYKNFTSTIIGGRSYDDISSYLNEEEKSVLAKNLTFRIWGNKESLKSRWEKMKVGDYVLFYARGTFYYSARVILTKYSMELAKKLWPLDEDGEPWPCLFFVDSLKEISIPIKVIQELAEYESTWDRVQGFMKLNDEGTQSIISKFGTIDSFLNQKPEIYKVIEEIIEDNKDESIEEVVKNSVFDKKQLLRDALGYQDRMISYKITDSPHKVRVENRIQKRRIAELEEYSCQLCGWSLEWINGKGKKVRRIDVDHIVDKAKGGGEEVTNLWVLCPNCHVKKTLKVITIDMGNKIIRDNGNEVKLLHDNHLDWYRN